MQYRKRLIGMAVAVLALGGARAFAAPPVFQPEVLLMKMHGGQQKSFSYARLKPAAADAKTLTAVFKYRASTEYVTCTVNATAPDARGIVHADITVQRSTRMDGEDSTFKSSRLDFVPGKPQIIDTQATLQSNQVDGTVEMLQLSVVKPEAPAPAPKTEP